MIVVSRKNYNLLRHAKFFLGCGCYRMSETMSRPELKGLEDIADMAKTFGKQRQVYSQIAGSILELKR